MQSSETSAGKSTTDPSPAMVKYLEEHDAYKSFLVGGHLASRKDIEEAGSETERRWDGVGGDEVHVTSEYISSFGRDTVLVQRLIACQKSQKSRMETPFAVTIGEWNRHGTGEMRQILSGQGFSCNLILTQWIWTLAS